MIFNHGLRHILHLPRRIVLLLLRRMRPLPRGLSHGDCTVLVIVAVDAGVWNGAAFIKIDLRTGIITGITMGVRTTLPMIVIVVAVLHIMTLEAKQLVARAFITAEWVYALGRITGSHAAALPSSLS